MLQGPLLDSYRQEIRQELIRKWTLRIAPLALLVLLLLAGLLYQSTSHQELSPLPLEPTPSKTALLAEADAGEGGTASAGSDSLQTGAADAAAKASYTHVTGRLVRNQRLLDVLMAHGLRRSQVEPALQALRSIYDPRQIRPGQEYELWLSRDGILDRFLLHVTPLRSCVVVLEGGSYQARDRRLEATAEVVRVMGTIESSLGAALAKAGERPGLAVKLSSFFGSEIDFRLHARKGDQFRLLVEKVMVEQQFLEYGRILAAEYKGKLARVRAFSYTDPEGRVGIYNELGQSLERLFLRSPVPGRPITSGYTRRRYHPILRRYMPHNGVDYGAPRGTPVLAAADGQVRFAGVKGPNGLLLVLSHDKGYRTHYAHLDRIASSVKVGARVHRGQVVAYVGNTGRSTGPHLHYGLSRDGRFIDPREPPPLRAPPVRSKYMKEFLAAVAPLSQDLDRMVLGEDPLLGNLVLHH